jgi:hypothetical protein
MPRLDRPVGPSRPDPEALEDGQRVAPGESRVQAVEPGRE